MDNTKQAMSVAVNNRMDYAGTATNALRDPSPPISDCIASCVSQTDQLLERLENAIQRLRPTPQKNTGGPTPQSSGLVQQSSDLASRLQYAVKLAEDVCAAVGV